MKAEIAQKLFHTTQDVVIVIDADYNIEDLNPKAREVFGVELLNKPNVKCYKAICKKSHPRANCPLTQLKNNNKNNAACYIENNNHYYQVKTSKVSLENNEVKYIDILHDITDFVKAEKKQKELTEEYQALNEEYLTSAEELEKTNTAIEKEKERYKQLFTNMNAAFAYHKIILDNKGVPVDYRFIDCNQKFEENTGLKANEIKGKTVLEVLPNTEKFWIETYGKVALTGSPVEFTNYAKELDKYFKIQAYSPQKGYFAVTFYNVSQRIRAEKQLEDVNAELQENLKLTRQYTHNIEQALKQLDIKERTLNAVFNNSPSIMMLLDETSNIIAMNDAGVKTVGTAKVKGLRGGDVLKCIQSFKNPLGCGHGPLCKNCIVRNSFATTLETGHATIKKETDFYLQQSNGNTIKKYLLISTSLIDEFEKRKVLVTIEDITELKQKEKDLIFAKENAERADQLKTVFLANMSHEIRTPLNGLLGFSEILAKRDNLTEQQKGNYIKVINECGYNLLQIVNDLMDISALENATLEINIKPFDVNDLLYDIQSFFNQKITDGNKPLALQVCAPEGQIIIQSDRHRVKQVFDNLIDNAIKFTPKGSIKFGVSKVHDNKIEFFVKDTGIGISPENTKVIFERFRQLEISPNRLYGGNGIGLSIVREMLDLLKGKIWLESEVGKGACFYFSLPNKQSNVENMPQKNNEPDNKTNKKLRILLVEDDEINISFINVLLGEITENITIARDGKTALDIAKKQNFDIILMDVGLPDIDGFEVTREIRAFDTKTPIIAQTAFAMDNDQQEAYKSGCTDFISKPLKWDDLKKKILKAVKA